MAVTKADRASPAGPLDQTAELWETHVGDATALRFALSLRRAHQALDADLGRALRPFGFGVARFELLFVLSRNPQDGMTIGALAAQLEVHRTTAAQSVALLEGQGLLTCTHDERDRRRVRVSLTDTGLEKVVEASRILDRLGFGVADLDETDMVAGTFLLSRLRSHPSVQAR